MLRHPTRDVYENAIPTAPPGAEVPPLAGACRRTLRSVTPSAPYTLETICTKCNGTGKATTAPFTLPQTKINLYPESSKCSGCRGDGVERITFATLDELRAHVTGL